jgi:hypothetical protein
MAHGAVFDRGSHVSRFVRIVLYATVLVGLLVGGLLLLEGGGSSPVRPLGDQNISSNHPNDVTTTTDNPNANCRHQPDAPPNCRPPSGM